jgi:hypothetical protein
LRDRRCVANVYWHRLTTAPDFLLGSHMQMIKGTSFSPGHGAWGAAV